MSDSQNLSDALAEFGRQLGDALTGMNLVTSAQGAIGWLVQGEAGKARSALASLDGEQRAKVAAAARELAALTEETA